MKIVPGAFGQANNLRWNEVKALLLTEQWAWANFWDYKVRADRFYEDGNPQKGLETLAIADGFKTYAKQIEAEAMNVSYQENSDFVGSIDLD
jgi:hypothetical protein